MSVVYSPYSIFRACVCVCVCGLQIACTWIPGLMVPNSLIPQRVMWLLEIKKNISDSRIRSIISKARNSYTRMCVRIRKISKSKDIQGGYPYIRKRVRLRMIFKCTEIVCRKTHDVFENAYIWIPSLRVQTTAFRPVSISKSVGRTWRLP